MVGEKTMTFQEVERLALYLMKRHKCPAGWRFEFDYRKGMQAYCCYDHKTITVDPAKLQEGYTKVKSLLLHEIAHSLCPGHDHDKVWHAEFVRLIRTEVWGE